jgi:hypothetical protein
MKKIILEEINRAREIMGLNPKVITEGTVTDDLFRAIVNKAYREGASSQIDFYINSQAKKLLPTEPGYNIDGLVDLLDDVSATGKKVNELIPGITDDLFEYLLTNPNTGIQGVFKKVVKEHVFPEEIIGTVDLATNKKIPGLYDKWNKGQLTDDEAEMLKSNILNLYKNVNNDAMKIALDDMNIVKRAKGEMKPAFADAKPSDFDDTQLLKFHSEIKDKVLRDKEYLLTQGDSKMLDLALTKSLIKQSDIQKLIDAKYPGFNKMFDLLDEYNRLYKLPVDKGGIGKISFEDWLEQTLKSRIPNKASELAIRTLRYFANPVRALAGKGNMNIWRAILSILGVTSGFYIGANALAQIISGMVNQGSNVLEKVDYKVNVEERWKDYWSPDNSPKVQIGDSTRSIYLAPDDSNETYKGDAPAIEVMDADNQIIKIMSPNTISINGKKYDQIYFELASTALGIGEGTVNPDLIKPYEGGDSENDTNKTNETPKEAVVLVSGEYNTVDATEDEKTVVINKIEATKSDWEMVDEDRNYIKKVDDGTNKKFEYEGLKNKYFVTID